MVDPAMGSSWHVINPSANPTTTDVTYNRPTSELANNNSPASPVSQPSTPHMQHSELGQRFESPVSRMVSTAGMATGSGANTVNGTGAGTGTGSGGSGMGAVAGPDMLLHGYGSVRGEDGYGDGGSGGAGQEGAASAEQNQMTKKKKSKGDISTNL